MTLENPFFRLSITRKGAWLTYFPATVEMWPDGDLFEDEFIVSVSRSFKHRTPFFYRWKYDGEPKWTLRLPFGWDITAGWWGQWRCAP